MANDQQVFISEVDPDWIDKTRTLIVSSRGVTSHQKQLMLSIFALLPHSKKQYPLQKHDVPSQIKQLCEQHKTRYFMYFEVKKKVNLALWLGRYPEGPSIKFMVDGVIQTRDIQFQGNSIRGARHIISFDAKMDTEPKFQLAKQLLLSALNIPKYHPKSTSVVDHTINFAIEDNEICFKNYQIFREAVSKQENKIDLYEIGPRFVMKIVCILDGVIGGEVLYKAPIVKKVIKKSKEDKRKYVKQCKPGEFNLFGEELDH